MENEFLRIGQELKKCREAKGLSIEKLAGKTKIAGKFIKNFEEGVFHFLPEVYIEAFLKSLASEVGLEQSVILRQYRAARDAKSENIIHAPKKAPSVGQSSSVQEIAVKPVRQMSPSGQPVEKKAAGLSEIISELKNITVDSKTIGMLTIGGLGLVILVFIFFSLPKGKSLKVERQVNNKQIKSPYNQQSSDSTAQLLHELPVSTLTVKASQNTWLRIVFDDSLGDEATFSPGDVRSWQSHGKFYLRIGNVGGVDLVLNGRNLGPAGQGPQIANLQIDENGIKPVAVSDFPAAMQVTRIP